MSSTEALGVCPACSTPTGDPGESRTWLSRAGRAGSDLSGRHSMMDGDRGIFSSSELAMLTSDGARLWPCEKRQKIHQRMW